MTPATYVVGVCGGLPERNQLLAQIYADVTGRVFSVAASAETPALGAAMSAAVAAGADAGGYDSIAEASRRMAHLIATSTPSTSSFWTCSGATATA